MQLYSSINWCFNVYGITTNVEKNSLLIISVFLIVLYIRLPSKHLKTTTPSNLKHSDMIQLHTKT